MNAKSNEISIMLDLETLGTVPGSKILSIAAVPFATGLHPASINAYPEFYEKINPIYPPEFRFTEDSATVSWWAIQNADVRAEAFSGTTSVYEVLRKFSTYLATFDGNVLLWGKGSDFDNVLLAAAYDKCELRLPWKFRNNRCFRTLAALAPEIKAPPMHEGEKAHNALHDARYQARHAEILLAYLQEDQ